jgi:radical SAM protein with 4Fe4S-binding SPASM domain
VRDSQRAPALRCGVCRGCTTVGIDGSLYPCHRYVGMKRYVVGHVRTGVNEQAHARYLGQYFRTKQKCSRCWLLNWCGGLCPWYVSHEDGTSRPPPEWRCAAVRESAEESAWLYEYVKEHHPSFFARVVEMDDKALLGSGKPTPTGDGSTGVRVEGQASLTALSEAEA